LDIPKNKLEQIILVKDFECSEESNIYGLEKVMDEMCSVQMDKLNRINRSCESEKIYIPLNEIRLNEIDIVRWDSIEIRKTASVVQKNYESRKNKPEKLKETAESEEQQKPLVANSEASQSVVEGFTKSSTTSSTPAAESLLFRNPNRSVNKIPLSQRTNT
jgi:Fe2+ transport system protein B